jgi:arylsulfatase A-like enzyme
LVAALICSVAAVSPGGGEAAKKKGKKQKRPNIVMLMTDDQHADSVRYMPQLQALIGDRGVTFDNSFVSYSLCCPSRATYLTGQYAHNHGVRTNKPPSGSYSKLAPTLFNSLPAWLKRSGYATAHVGKFLNGYGNTSPDTEVPAGWTEWYGALDDPDAYDGGTYSMYGYTLNENGSIVHYGSTPDVVDPATYQTDVYSAKAVDFIRRRAPKNKPFFLSVAPLASHGEGGTFAPPDDDPRAAPRHQGAFAGLALPKPPNYNEADVSDKPQNIQNLEPIGATAETNITNRYRARLESLLAVDDMVGNLVAALKDKGELKNTVIIFTTDNGFFHGEHRVRTGKVRLYEPSIRLPLIIRGPGVPKDKRRDQLVANVDLAPTILDFANAKAGRKEDGQSLLPLIRDKRLQPGRGILLEAFFNADPGEDPDTPDQSYAAVRTERYLYAEHGSGAQELYDLFGDPFELQSQHANPAFAGVKASLDQLLERLRNCAGGGCRSRPALKLKLQFRNAGGCVAGAVRAKLAGGSAGQVESARFFARGRKIGNDGSAPFKKKAGAGALSGSRKNRIEAVATMLDGRRVTVARNAPPRC